MTKVRPCVLSKRTITIAENYLSKTCAVMEQLIVTHGACPLALRDYRPFQTLVTAIISQQLSAKAADTIKNRLFEIVPSFSPTEFLAIPVDLFRRAGLSSAKTRYILNLSSLIIDKRLDFNTLSRQPDDDVINALTKMPGIGRWTAEMFLIFGLKRADVLSLGDAGLQRSVRILFGDDAQLEHIGQAWRPYCSVASWYLWSHLDKRQ